MADTLDLMLALEKVKRPLNQSHVVYTYVLSPEGSKPAGYFIPLYVAPNEERADEIAQEIIETTGYKDILTYPMGLWISLGDSTAEKVTPVEVRDNLKEYAKKEDEKKVERSKERRRIEAEVQAEQKAIHDPESIESYYYDWFCAVQNKARRDALKEEMEVMDVAYKKRLDNIKAKTMKHPNYQEEWKPLLLERLSRRGEKNHAEVVIQASEEIRHEECL